MYIEAEVVRCAGQDAMSDTHTSHTIMDAKQDDLIAMSDGMIGAKRMTRRWCEIDSGSLFFCFPTLIVTDVTATHLAMKGFSLVEHNERSSSI